MVNPRNRFQIRSVPSFLIVYSNSFWRTLLDRFIKTDRRGHRVEKWKKKTLIVNRIPVLETDPLTLPPPPTNKVDELEQPPFYNMTVSMWYFYHGPIL